MDRCSATRPPSAGTASHFLSSPAGAPQVARASLGVWGGAWDAGASLILWQISA